MPVDWRSQLESWPAVGTICCVLVFCSDISVFMVEEGASEEGAGECGRNGVSVCGSLDAFVKAYRFGTTIWQAAGGWVANGRVPRGKRGHYTIRVGYPVPVLRAPGRSISAHSVQYMSFALLATG